MQILDKEVSGNRKAQEILKSGKLAEASINLIIRKNGHGTKVQIWLIHKMWNVL